MHTTGRAKESALALPPRRLYPGRPMTEAGLPMSAIWTCLALPTSLPQMGLGVVVVAPVGAAELHWYPPLGLPRMTREP